MTGGRGPDACIDCVGLEAYGRSADAIYDRARTTLMIATDRPTALRQAVRACRKGGVLCVLFIPGVHGGFVDELPLGAAFSKGLTFKMGQTHVQRYLRPLLQLVQDGKIDPSFVITHRVPLESGPRPTTCSSTSATGA